MPTSDPIRRREQNRDNQKKYRVRQSQQLADLRTAYEVQSTQLCNAERDVEDLQRKNADALRMVAQLRAINSGLLAQISALPDITRSFQVDSDPAVAEDALFAATCNEQINNVLAEAHFEKQPQMSTSLNIVGPMRVNGRSYSGLETHPCPQVGPELSFASHMNHRSEFIAPFVISGASYTPQDESWATITELGQTVLPTAQDAQLEWSHGCEDSSTNDEDAQIPRSTDLNGTNSELYGRDHTNDVWPAPCEHDVPPAHSSQALVDHSNLPCNARSEADVPSDILHDDLLSLEARIIADLPQSLTTFPATSRISKHILAATRILRREFMHVQAKYVRSNTKRRLRG